MKANKNRQLRFEVDRYAGDGSDIDTSDLSLAQVREIDLRAHDTCRAECLGVYGFRDPASGEWTEYGRRLGPIAKAVLVSIQWQTPVLLEPDMLETLTGEPGLADPTNRASAIHRLRVRHGETKQTEHFIRTVNGSVGWPPGLSWIAVKPFIPAVACDLPSEEQLLAGDDHSRPRMARRVSCPSGPRHTDAISMPAT